MQLWKKVGDSYGICLDFEVIPLLIFSMDGTTYADECNLRLPLIFKDESNDPLDKRITVLLDDRLHARAKVGAIHGYKDGMHMNPAQLISARLEGYIDIIKFDDPLSKKKISIEIVCGRIDRDNDKSLEIISDKSPLGLMALELSKNDEIDIFMKPGGKLPESINRFVIRSLIIMIEDESKVFEAGSRKRNFNELRSLISALNEQQIETAISSNDSIEIGL